MRSRDPGSDFVPRISTKRLRRGRVSSKDLYISEIRRKVPTKDYTDSEVFLRLIALGLLVETVEEKVFNSWIMRETSFR